jgi:PAS domain S-box-containing protein
VSTSQKVYGSKSRLTNYIARQPPWRLVALSIAYSLLLGILDYLTGPDLTLFVFYLTPVALVTWFAGRRAGWAITVLAFGIWFLASGEFKHPYPTPFLAFCNILTRLAYFVVVVALLSSLKRDHDQLRESEERYRSLITELAEGVVLLDREGIIRACNPAAARILGHPPEAIIGRNSIPARGVTVREDGSPLAPEDHPSMTTLRTGEPQSQIVMGIVVSKDKTVWISVSTQPLQREGESRPYAVVASFADITERVEWERQLRFGGTPDALTGLYNRAFFDEEMARLQKGRQFPVSLILADVDQLKATNDRYGHTEGDELLKRAARAVSQPFRAGDIVARVGRDEFAVLLPSTDTTAAMTKLAFMR